MADRAAIVTGGSGGIGQAIAEVLGEEGFGITIASRRAERLAPVADGLRAKGYDVQDIAADVSDEEAITDLIARHRDRYGRLDVLVNNAGIGFGAAVAEIATKRVDIQLDVNLRSMIIFYREALELLQAAAAERGTALVVNLASLAGKSGQAWLSVYSATKHGVVGWTEAMNKELAPQGIKSTALCPGFVDTNMTEFIRDTVKREDMIQPSDIGETVRLLLRVSRRCLIPEVMYMRPGEQL